MTQQRVFSEHPSWDKKKGWKNLLNNLRLVIQPFVYFNLIKPWFAVFPMPRQQFQIQKSLKRNWQVESGVSHRA
jgi:threonyl-tRNA synthetase